MNLFFVVSRKKENVVRSRNKAKPIRRRAVLDGMDTANITMIQQRTCKVRNLASPLGCYWAMCFK